MIGWIFNQLKLSIENSVERNLLKISEDLIQIKCNIENTKIFHIIIDEIYTSNGLCLTNQKILLILFIFLY
jgi:hypothetical protein